MDYLLGIDAGTSVIKAAIFDATLKQVAVASQPTRLQTPNPGWVEADMHVTWEVALRAIREVLATANVDPTTIKAVGVTGSMVGAWLIDNNGSPVRPAILFNDARTQPMIQEWTQADPTLPETIFASSGSVMQPGCTLPLIRWLAEHEPDTLARAAHVLCCKDWLVYQMTGAVINDPSQASVMPGSAQDRTYAEPLFDLLDVREYRHLFPAVVASEEVVGTITPDAANVTGLVAGTPVVAGAGDVLATAIGAGAVEPGVAYTILGTACINGLVMDQPDLAPQGIGLTFCQPADTWVRVMINVLGTANLDWFTTQFFPELNEDPTRFSEYETRAASRPQGANGVIYLPYLSPSGMFAPIVEPTARAQFFGLTHDHTRDDMLRAVYEGVAFGIRDCHAAFPAAVGEIRLTGGGASSAFWSQCIADVTGKRVVVPTGQEFGARGAAFLAGLGINGFASVKVAAAHTDISHTYEPRPDAAYDHNFAVYCQMTEALRPVWQRAAHTS